MAKPTPADRLALAICRGGAQAEYPCATPCSTCRNDAAAVARQVAAELYAVGFGYGAEAVLRWLPAEDYGCRRRISVGD